MKWKIHNFILKFFKLFISLKTIKFLEREFSLIQGKGYGAITIDEEINACRKLIGKHNVKNILDIGANKGEYTKKLLKYYPNANYYLFEPSKFSSNILLKELKKFKNNQPLFEESLQTSQDLHNFPYQSVHFPGRF